MKKSQNNAKQVWEGLGFIVELKGINAEKYLNELSKGEWDVFRIDYAINSADAFAWLAPFATAFSGNEVSVTLEAATYTPTIPVLRIRITTISLIP